MNAAIKIAIALLSLPLLVLGFIAMFNPTGMFERLAVEPQGIHGLSTIRADVGGLLLGGAIMMLIGLWRSNTTWFLAVAVMMSAVAFGRLVGLVVDGVGNAVMLPLAVELVTAGLMLLARRRLSRVGVVTTQRRDGRH